MNKTLAKVFEMNGWIADEMTIWVGNDASCGKANGYIIYNHDGINTIRKALPNFKVYTLRESDDLDGNPASIENKEVMVNFFGYFITQTDLDYAFTNKDWQEVWDWDYDPWN